MYFNVINPYHLSTANNTSKTAVATWCYKGRHQKKKMFFFGKTLKFRAPPPLPAVWRVQFFLIRKFWNRRDPPPFGEKFRNILSIFL